MKFTDKKINTGDINVSYVDEGQHKGIPLIFIHGFPFTKAMWENQIDECKEHYRVIAYDIRGYGNSDLGTHDYSIAQCAEDLFLFMDALQIEKAFICGLSMGGYIALNALLQRPKRIAALILCDSQCLPDSNVSKKKRMDSITSIQEKGLAEYTHDSLMKLFSETSLANKKETVSFVKQTILDARIESICKTLMALAERKETCSALHLINIPVLIIVGEEDQITTPEVAKRMHELIPGSKLYVIENAGHLSNLENPESFNLQLQNFLKRIA